MTLSAEMCIDELLAYDLICALIMISISFQLLLHKLVETNVLFDPLLLWANAGILATWCCNWYTSAKMKLFVMVYFVNGYM